MAFHTFAPDAAARKCLYGEIWKSGSSAGRNQLVPDTRLDPQTVYDREALDSLCMNTLPYAIRYRVAEFTGAELKVWMCFLSHANRQGKRAFVGMKRLLDETGLSEHGLDNAIAGLKKKGWINRFPLVNAQLASA